MRKTGVRTIVAKREEEHEEDEEEKEKDEEEEEDGEDMLCGYLGYSGGVAEDRRRKMGE